MTQKFEEFYKEVKELCEKYKVVIEPSYYDVKICVRNSEDWFGIDNVSDGTDD